MSREMRHSGIEWIGEIPKEWKITLSKRLFSIVAGATPKTDNVEMWDGDITWITPADYKTEDKFVSSGRRNLSEKGKDSCATYLLPCNSIVFSKRAPIGLVAITAKELCTNQGCLGCIPSGQLIVLFYYYAMSAFTEQFELMGTGTTFKEISATKFANFPLPFPPLSEQQKIANYLDKVCGEVDEMIALQEQMIEELKAYKQSVITEAVTKGLNPNAPMKNSGIDWIGEIPEHWEVKRLKQLLRNCDNNLKVGPFGSALSGNDFKEDGYWVYNQRTVLDSNFETNNTFVDKDKYIELQSFQVLPGDILITTRGSIGKIAIVPNNAPAGILHPCIIRFVIDDNMYFISLLKHIFNESDFISRQVSYQSNSTTIDVLYSNTLKNIVLPYPPLAEQQSIASYLDTKCAEIDALIAIKQAKIEELKDYKKSVIYEYVTGKKEVN